MFFEDIVGEVRELTVSLVFKTCADLCFVLMSLI